MNFYNTTRLNHERNKGNVFVQTDKGAYRPGDLVRFRVIFLDHTLRPIQFEDILSQANVLIEVCIMYILISDFKKFHICAKGFNNKQINRFLSFCKSSVEISAVFHILSPLRKHPKIMSDFFWDEKIT